MKNTILLLSCALSLSLAGQQTLQLKDYDNNTPLLPNAIIVHPAQAYENVKITFDLKNTSATTQTYTAIRYDVSLNATASATAAAYFCFAGTCFGPQVVQALEPLVLAPGQSASEVAGDYQMLVSDLDEIDQPGLSIVKYTFANTNNPADSVQVSIHYNGIAKQNFNQNFHFSDVNTSSGTVDPTPVPVIFGGTFGSFGAVGLGSNPSSTGSFGYSGWPSGATNGSNDESAMTGAINTGQYYQITVTPLPGYYVTLNHITFDVSRSNDGARNYAVRSTVDTYGANIPAAIESNPNLSQANGMYFWKYDSIGGMQSGSKNLLDDAGYKNFTSPITFRFYAWNSEATAGNFGIDNVVFDGFASVNVVTTGIVSHDLRARFRLFPNPANGGKVTIETPADIHKIELFTAGGTLAGSHPGEGSGLFILDLTGLSSGIYYIRLSGKTSVYTEKLIITE